MRLMISPFALALPLSLALAGTALAAEPASPACPTCGAAIGAPPGQADQPGSAFVQGPGGRMAHRGRLLQMRADRWGMRGDRLHLRAHRELRAGDRERAFRLEALARDCDLRARACDRLGRRLERRGERFRDLPWEGR